MKDHLNAVKRMLAFVFVGASVITALSVGGSLQDQPRHTEQVATIATARS